MRPPYVKQESQANDYNFCISSIDSPVIRAINSGAMPAAFMPRAASKSPSSRPICLPSSSPNRGRSCGSPHSDPGPLGIGERVSSISRSLHRRPLDPRMELSFVSPYSSKYKPIFDKRTHGPCVPTSVECVYQAINDYNFCISSIESPVIWAISSKG